MNDEYEVTFKASDAWPDNSPTHSRRWLSPLVSENTTQVSDHVCATMGFPNIAIVVGSRASRSSIRVWA